MLRYIEWKEANVRKYEKNFSKASDFKHCSMNQRNSMGSTANIYASVGFEYERGTQKSRFRMRYLSIEIFRTRL